MENFVAMKRFVADEVINYHNPYPFLEGLYLQVTNRVLMVEMEERERGDDKKQALLFGNQYHCLQTA